MSIRRNATAASLWALLLLGAGRAQAHCDTMDGPVVKDATAALASGDVTPVLKWVQEENETEIRQAFELAVKVRGLATEARALADRSFLETLVRIHREGEGASYAGLKPAGLETQVATAAADKALDTGSPGALVAVITADVERGLRQRFARAAAAKRRAHESVERGREYVRAYVDFVHYAERVHEGAAPSAGAHEHEPPAPRHP
jgi:hypothetical protein